MEFLRAEVAEKVEAWLRKSEGDASRESNHAQLGAPVGAPRIFGDGDDLQTIDLTGAGAGNRTPDLLITSQLLCQLSYASTTESSLERSDRARVK